MAANMPLLVDRDWNRGAVVYSTHLDDAAQIRLSPHPVARWPGGEEQSVGALAVVSGPTTILATVHGSGTTMVDVVHGGGADHQATRLLLGSEKRCPAMLPVGDDTVVVMDRVGARGFEALRRLPDGASWRADPLPDPPIHDDDEEDYDEEEDEDEDAEISSYFAIGTRVWISVTGRGTFSLDAAAAAERGAAWRTEGSWELPLEKRAFFAPELGGGGGSGSVVIGIACRGVDGIDGGDYRQRCCQVCALDVGVGEGRRPAARRVWQIPAARPEDVEPGEEVSLAYLGDGRICVARSVVVELSKVRGTSFKGKGTSFTVAKVTDDGEMLRLATSSHVWPQGHLGHATFIQPA